MNLYLASSSQHDALSLAKVLVSAGHVITSSWVYKPLKRTSEYTDDQRTAIAVRNLSDITASDVLILLGNRFLCPGGKHVEVGYALGVGKPVWVLGPRENLLLWHPGVRWFEHLNDLLTHLRAVRDQIEAPHMKPKWN